MKSRLALLTVLVLALCALCAAGLADDEWTCPNCSTVNHGKFCAECGTAKPEPVAWTCPACGAENMGKFCGECGTARPEPGPASVTVTVEFNEKVREGEYTGDLKDGKPDGTGTFTSADAYAPLTYEGEWKDGAVSGKGYAESGDFLVHFLTYGQGKFDRTGTFKGEVVDGIPQGQGYFTSFNDEGVRWDYTGAWENGSFNGEGLHQWYGEDGSVIQVQEGRFVDGEYMPVSVIIPADADLSGQYVSTKKATISITVQNVHKEKTVESYTLVFYSYDKDGNAVTETETDYQAAVIAPGEKKNTREVYVTYEGAAGVSFGIVKVTYTDKSYEVVPADKAVYSSWDVFE